MLEVSDNIDIEVSDTVDVEVSDEVALHNCHNVIFVLSFFKHKTLEYHLQTSLDIDYFTHFCLLF